MTEHGQPQPPRVGLSVVSTVYKSEAHLVDFYRRASAAAALLTPDYEIVLVDDGSPDGSRDIAVSLAQQDPRLVVIELSRNFGHHLAMMTGLARARGQLVFMLDSDLEEQPEWLLEFVRRLEESRADVVYGVQGHRKGGWFERLSGTLFYRLLNALSDVPVPANLVTARLMTRRYVRALVRHRDRDPFMAGLWFLTGFAQVPAIVDKLDRGDSSYTLPRRLAHVVDSVTSFTRKPLIWMFYLGTLIVMLSTIGGSALIYHRLAYGYLPGWASLMVSVWMLGGITIFCVGLIGLYVSRIFLETKHRPMTVIRHVHRAKRRNNF